MRVIAAIKSARLGKSVEAFEVSLTCQTKCARKWEPRGLKETSARESRAWAERRKKKKRKIPVCNFSDVRKCKETAYAEGEDGLIIHTDRPTGASTIINDATCARALIRARASFARGGFM